MYPLNVSGREDPISYQFLNRTLRVATPIARPSPIQNGVDVAEAEPVRTNLHYYYARYNFTCHVVLKWKLACHAGDLGAIPGPGMLHVSCKNMALNIRDCMSLQAYVSFR